MSFDGMYCIIGLHSRFFKIPLEKLVRSQKRDKIICKLPVDQNICDKIAFNILTKADRLAPILFQNRIQFAEKRTFIKSIRQLGWKLQQGLTSALKSTLLLTINRVNFAGNRVTSNR